MELLPALRVLELETSSVTVDYGSLRGCRALQKLRVHVSADLLFFTQEQLQRLQHALNSSIATLSELTSLTCLHLQTPRCDLRPLLKMVHLETLWVSEATVCTSSCWPPPLPRLRELVVERKLFMAWPIPLAPAFQPAFTAFTVAMRQSQPSLIGDPIVCDFHQASLPILL